MGSRVVRPSRQEGRIWDNDGIDLGDDGVTPNDVLDVDTGPNDLLNHPELVTADEGDGNTSVSFDLDVPAAVYRVELFSNTAVDPSGGAKASSSSMP